MQTLKKPDFYPKKQFPNKYNDSSNTNEIQIKLLDYEITSLKGKLKLMVDCNNFEQINNISKILYHAIKQYNELYKTIFKLR